MTVNLDRLVKILCVDLLKNDIAKVQRGLQELRGFRLSTFFWDDEKLVRLGGLTIIVSTMRKWTGDAIIQACGCAVIRRCLEKYDTDKQHSKILVDEFQYFDLLFLAMRKHTGNKELQKSVLRQLVHFAESSDDFRNYFISNYKHQDCIFVAAKWSEPYIRKLVALFFSRMVTKDSRVKPLIDTTEIQSMVKYDVSDHLLNLINTFDIRPPVPIPMDSYY